MPLWTLAPAAIFLIATFVILALGVSAMARGNPQRSNKLMRWRVAMQALAVLSLALAALAAGRL